MPGQQRPRSPVPPQLRCPWLPGRRAATLRYITRKLPEVHDPDAVSKRGCLRAAREFRAPCPAARRQRHRAAGGSRVSLSAGRKTPEQRRRRRSDGARAEDGARPRLQGPGRGSASPRAGLRGRPSRAGGGRGETRLVVSARQGLGASTTKHERAKTELTAGNPCHRHHRPSAAARAAPRMPPDAARIQDTKMEQRGEPGR